MSVKITRTDRPTIRGTVVNWASTTDMLAVETRAGKVVRVYLTSDTVVEYL